MRFLILCTISIFFIFCSCAYKKVSHNTIVKNIHTPIFIQMPENVLVFDNISSTVYKSLWDYFEQLGYRLADSECGAFVLKVKVKQLEPIHKFISPDVLTYGQRIKLELFCSAFDSKQKLLVQKNFIFSSLLCKPKNPILNTDFLEFEYCKLLQRAAPKIEQYFRSYWMK